MKKKLNHLGIDVGKKKKCMITLKDDRGKTRDQFFFGSNSWNTGTNLKDTEL
jgi:hypothetical protein